MVDQHDSRSVSVVGAAAAAAANWKPPGCTGLTHAAAEILQALRCCWQAIKASTLTHADPHLLLAARLRQVCQVCPQLLRHGPGTCRQVPRGQLGDVQGRLVIIVSRLVAARPCMPCAACTTASQGRNQCLHGRLLAVVRQPPAAPPTELPCHHRQSHDLPCFAQRAVQHHGNTTSLTWHSNRPVSRMCWCPCKLWQQHTTLLCRCTTSRTASRSGISSNLWCMSFASPAQLSYSHDTQVPASHAARRRNAPARSCVCQTRIGTVLLLVATPCQQHRQRKKGGLTCRPCTLPWRPVLLLFRRVHPVHCWLLLHH